MEIWYYYPHQILQVVKEYFMALKTMEDTILWMEKMKLLFIQKIFLGKIMIIKEKKEKVFLFNYQIMILI